MAAEGAGTLGALPLSFSKQQAASRAASMLHLASFFNTACMPTRPPAAVLKTRRSMRAVHFHPHGLPIVLTAEVQDPSPTPELPATLTEQGPYVQQAEGAGRAAASAAGAAAPPSGEVPIPSAQLLQGAAAAGIASTSSAAACQQQHQQQDALQPPAAGVYVATPDGPVPVGQLAGAAGGVGAAQPGAQPMEMDLPAAALALSAPLHHLHLRTDTASPAPVAGDRPGSSGGPSTSGRPGAPGWVPPGSAQLPPSMVPTGWELPFPSSLFSGGQQQGAGAAAAAGPGQVGVGGIEGSGGGGWAATDASLPQVMAAFSAAAWNIIGEEQPPRVRLRMWRFDAARPAALLAVLGSERGSGNLKLQVSDAVLCSGGLGLGWGWWPAQGHDRAVQGRTLHIRSLQMEQHVQSSGGVFE